MQSSHTSEQNVSKTNKSKYKLELKREILRMLINSQRIKVDEFNSQMLV